MVEGGGSEAQEARWPGWLAATAICLRFYSRLPLPRLGAEDAGHAVPDFRTVPRALPFAAVLIALPAAIIIVLAGLVGLGSVVAATLAVAALVMTTGALHEDGLADSADGLFGGQTPERRLEIMKDSRVGSYGALALGLSLLLRIGTLAAIVDRAGLWAATAALLAAACWSRCEGLRILSALPPARSDGAAAAVGRPETQTVVTAFTFSAALGFGLSLITALPIGGLVLGWALAGVSTWWLLRLAQEKLGGQSGDIVGAAQQLAEIALYLGIAIALGLAAG